MLTMDIETARRFILGKQGLWPGLWEDLAYQQRKFFDWGGWLAVRPMDELPDFRVVMRREREGDPDDPRIRGMAAEHAEAIEEMRAILRERGTVSNRDFEMASRTRTQSYRGRKDSALALYYLWRTGEVMRFTGAASRIGPRRRCLGRWWPRATSSRCRWRVGKGCATRSAATPRCWPM